MLRKIKDRLRHCFMAGMLTVVPLLITIYVISVLLTNADRVLNLIPHRYDPRGYIPFPLPGLGAALVVLAIFLTGLLVRNYVGRRIVDYGERLVAHIPVVRPVYAAIKQLLSAVFDRSYQKSFKHVVMIEHPRQGIYALAFLTGSPTGEIQDLSSERLVNVFVPTTPNPTSGYYLMVRESELIPLQLPVEEGFKWIISGGLAASDAPSNGTNDSPGRLPPSNLPVDHANPSISGRTGRETE